MTEPTDAELEALIAANLLVVEGGQCAFESRADIRPELVKFARAVLAKWGTPPAVAPWRSAVLDLIDDCPGLTLEQDRWLSRRVKELDFASTPQPTQAQAGAVPLTEEQIGALSCRDGLTNVEVPVIQWLVREVEFMHGIKGGQHGPS
ncbi:hypothetical protein LJR074_003250 [Acidovorax sp. LjRoot74]|uniref:hypothetical protein n=1 Tax=Acidovorax sp. LjRoot74 TaxID=3342337 RepID=UPI003ECC7BD0